METGLSQITAPMLGLFDTAQSTGITIVVAAIGIGVIFVVAKWLWGKTKTWLKAV
jgi:hypothetical protein